MLHFGPYRTLRYRLGQEVQCSIRGKVTVYGVTTGQIPWPHCRQQVGRPSIVVCGVLAKGFAVKACWPWLTGGVSRLRRFGPGDVPLGSEGTTRER